MRLLGPVILCLSYLVLVNSEAASPPDTVATDTDKEIQDGEKGNNPSGKASNEQEARDRVELEGDKVREDNHLQMEDESVEFGKDQQFGVEEVNQREVNHQDGAGQMNHQDTEVQDGPEEGDQDAEVQDSPKEGGQDAEVQDSPKEGGQDAEAQDSPKDGDQDAEVQHSPKEGDQDAEVQDSGWPGDNGKEDHVREEYDQANHGQVTGYQGNLDAEEHQSNQQDTGKVSKESVQDDLQDTSDQDLQDTGDQNKLQDTVDQDLQDTGDQNKLQETGDQDLQDTGDQDLQDTGDQDLQDTGDQNKLQETGDQDLQDTGEDDQDTPNEQKSGEQRFEEKEGAMEAQRESTGDESSVECVPKKPGDCVSSLPFPLEEDEPDYERYLEGIDMTYSIDPYDKTRGYELLQEAARKGNTRALETLAYGYIIGTQLKRNFTRAFEIFSELANKGNPIGQQGLGYMYSTGVGVNSNQAKAVVYYVFAALGGHQYAQMAMGYRAHMGVGVVQSCESALAYYQKSATEVIRKVSLIAGSVMINKVRLMDEDDETPSMYGVSEDEIIHYQSIFTDSGNTRAQFTLGIYYMFGLAGAQRSFQMALHFLQQAAEGSYPAAYVLMGKIYAEGNDEVRQDYDLAYENFQMAADMKFGDGYSGLGMLYYNGMGVRKDKLKALELFQKAADRSSAEGHYYLGMMYYSGDGVRRDVGKGIKSFQLASHGGHLHAIYMLGVINAEGDGVKRSCTFAVELFKTVSERGHFTRMFTEAQRLYGLGEVESSFLTYTVLAELGFEEAQSNVAYLLERGDLSFVGSEEDQLKRALLFWNRAAAQGYYQARVKLGDYYYYGLGTKVSYEAAATQYRMASDKLGTPQAMFNLGYMYEHGEGLEQDYHLAKRYYDMAAQTSSEAIVPVNMALFKLNLVYTLDHYKEWFDMQSWLGGKWDIYLMSLLASCVVILLLWRTRA